jgi:membrane-bound ClpP family serine protease
MPLTLILVIALISIGIIFLLIEFFLLPGISIAGIAGAIFLVGGIVYAYIFLGATAGNISVAASAVTLGGLFLWLLKSKSLRKISLETNIEEKVDNSHLQQAKVGDTGIAVSRLNPIGKVMINDVQMEGKSFDNEFIEEEAEIEVVRVDSMNVIVKRLESSTLPVADSNPAQELPSEPPAPLSARLRSGNAQQLQG